MQPDLGTLPFPEQLEQIEEGLRRGDAAGLLIALASLRDHEPLVWLVKKLGRQGGLSGPAMAAALREVMAALPDSGLHRVLRGLERGTLDPDQEGRLFRPAALARCDDGLRQFLGATHRLLARGLELSPRPR